MEPIRMKTFCLSILFVFLLFATTSAESIQGDINQDGGVDDRDRFLLERSLGAGINDPDWCEECDLNHDGYIDFTDLELLVSNLGKRAIVSPESEAKEGKEREFKRIPLKVVVLEKTPLTHLNPWTLERTERDYFGAEILVDTAGSVLDIKISKSSGYKPVDVYLITELKKWKFKPVIIDEKTVNSWIYYRINLKENYLANPLCKVR